MASSASPRVAEARRGIAREHLREERPQRRRHAPFERHVGGEPRHELIAQRRAREERPDAQQIEQDEPRRIDVGRGPRLFAAKLLGGHERRRPEDHPVRHVDATDRFGEHRGATLVERDPEVEQPRFVEPAPPARDDHVRRLDVAMHDPVRVRFGQPREHPARHAEHLVREQRPAERHGVEGHAVDELHDEVQPDRLVVPEVVHPGNVP